MKTTLTFTFPLLPPTGAYFWTRPVLHSRPSFFFFVNVNCSKEFCLGILYTHMSYFNQINPFFLFLIQHPIIQQLSICFIVSSSNTDAVYFDIIHSLSYFSLLLLPVSSTVLLFQTCPLSTYLSIHLPFRSSFHIWGNKCDLCLSEPGLLCLSWCSPVELHSTCSYFV
jgi:hypothetical protein